MLDRVEDIDPGFHQITSLLDELDVPWPDYAAPLRRTIDAGRPPYLDNIHLNAAGQRVLAEALYDAVRPLIEEDAQTAR